MKELNLTAQTPGAPKGGQHWLNKYVTTLLYA